MDMDTWNQMARRPSEPPPSLKLTPDQMRQGIERLKKRVSDIEDFKPESVRERWSAPVKALQASIGDTLSKVFGHNTPEYDRYIDAASLDDGWISTLADQSHAEIVE